MTDQKETPLDTDLLGGEVSRGADTAAGLPGRITRYSKARERALEMHQFTTDHGHVKEAKALGDCGNYLLFHHYYTVDQVKLAGMHSCRKHLLCPLCAIRRGAKAMKAYLDRFEVIQDQNPNLKPYLVTFTVKNGEDLWERFTHLRNSLKRLHKKRQGTRQHTEASKAAGAVWSYEVTNKGNGWHPHAHAIWLCEEAPDAQALQDEWFLLTGDSFVLDVRPITGYPVDGFLEVFKYATKFSDLVPAQTWEVYQTLHGERLLSSFGAFRGVDVPDELTDELLDSLPYIELFYRYLRGAGYTLEKMTKHEPPPDPLEARLRVLFDLGWSDEQIVAFLESPEGLPLVDVSPPPS